LEECCPTRNEERGKKSVFLPAEVWILLASNSLPMADK
jgi:hypothetical protein